MTAPGDGPEVIAPGAFDHLDFPREVPLTDPAGNVIGTATIYRDDHGLTYDITVDGSYTGPYGFDTGLIAE